MRQENCGTLVVGAGLAGLSAAHFLGERPYRLVEREAEVGGLCRSVREAGFTFDYTGHLLHIRRPEIRELVSSLLGEEAFRKIHRHSGIYSHGCYTEYPFQVNTFGLPKAVVRECVSGFAETLQHAVADASDTSFHDWILATFGPGIARHFMLPYNRKLFCTDLRSMTADWVAWSIPKPTWEDVVRGALGTNRKDFGYNPSFLYPRYGGIDHLPRAFLPSVREPMLSTEVVAIHSGRREATLSNGETLSYESVISTVPLPALVRRIEDAPTDVRDAARRLRQVSVLNLNLGFDSPCLKPYHWIYFPEEAFPFYRIGVYSNLSAESVPAGASAYYVEIAHPPDAPPDPERLIEPCAQAIREIGLVSPRARLIRTRAIDIAYAYVIHDRARSAALPVIHEYLETQGILSVGRYGAWEYSAMEDAIWHGKEAAERLTAMS